MSQIIHSKKEGKTIRNFRIHDIVWQQAKKKANDLGINNMTFLMECLLQDFIKTPQLVIGEPEIVDVPEDMRKELDELAHLADKAVEKKKITS